MRDPADAVIAVTHRCNAHCVMCNVWRSRGEDRLQPEHMNRLPRGLRTINLSGGEPFLRPDLAEFVRHARRRCPRAVITISTNGYLPDRVAEVTDRIVRIDPRVRLALSLDGVGPAHDRIRGDAGAYESAMDLIRRLKADGYGGLRLGMTLSEGNLRQFTEVAAVAQREGLEIGVVAAHAAGTHLGIDRSAPAPPKDLAEGFERIISRWLRSPQPKLWLRAHFAWNTWRALIGRRWRFRCQAARGFFFCQADGTVYSCSVRGRPLGNITDQNWREIWSGPVADEARREAASCGAACWMICTVRGVYRRRLPEVLGWIAKRKLQAHLGNLRLPAAEPEGEADRRRWRADTAH